MMDSSTCFRVGNWLLLVSFSLGIGFSHVSLAEDEQGMDAHGFYLRGFDGDLGDPLTLQRPVGLIKGRWYVGGLFEYARSPLVALGADGTRITVLDHVVGLNTSGGYVILDGLAVEAALPIFLNATGELVDSSGPALGDMRMSAIWAIIQPNEKSEFGASISPHLDLPTGASKRFLGQRTVSGGFVTAGAWQRGPWGVTANLGLQFNPSIDRGNLNGADEVLLGAAASYLPLDNLGVQLEYMGRIPFIGNAVSGTGSPGELIGTVRYQSPFLVHFISGFAGAVTPGVGAAAFRVFLGVGYSGSASRSDKDDDGFLDGVDACPEDPETLNHFQDDDGCPDELPTLMIEVLHQGQPARGAQVTLSGEETYTLEYNTDPIIYDVGPNTEWRIEAALGFCLYGEARVSVEESKQVAQVPLLLTQSARLNVMAMDYDGRPLAGATVRTADSDEGCGLNVPIELDGQGMGFVDVGVGAHRVIVEAPGYAPHEQQVELEAGSEGEVLAVMGPDE
jgi:hypothetical protein